MPCARRAIQWPLILILSLSQILGTSLVLAQPRRSATQGRTSFGVDALEPDDSRSLGSRPTAGDRLEEEVSVQGIPYGGPGSDKAIFYTIHILGEIHRPGTYKILPSDRLTDALKYAGGVTFSGSPRRVELRRAGSGTSVLDMFAYKIGGQLSQNPYLMENDVVYVPVKKGEFQIEGPVVRTGVYELVKEISVNQAVAMAGGFTVGRSFKEPIRIIRFNEEEKKEVLEVENSEEAMKSLKVKKGDIIVVPHILTVGKTFDYNVTRIPGDNIFYPTANNNVYVIGAVSQGGAYTFVPAFTYRDYVSIAGPLNSANVKRARILRADGKRMTAKKDTAINPGDTIIVSNKTVTAGNFITLFNTLTNMALTSFIFVDRFAD